MHLFALFALLGTSFLHSGWAQAHSRGTYDSETEAMSRAQQMGCTTVHQNNGRWMPCSDERELHQQLRKQ